MTKEEVIQEIKNCIVDCMSLIDTENVDECIDRMLNLWHKLGINNLFDLTNKTIDRSDVRVQTELTINGDQTKGIYFTFKGYNFHITKDSEYNNKFISDLYHIWCECRVFNGEEMPISHTYVTWLFGGSFLEEEHKAFLTGKITKQEFEQYLWDDVNIHCSDWLEKNKEKIGK